MTPDTFSHNVGAWLAALTALVAPLLTFIGAIFGILAYLKSHTNELRLNGQSSKIDTLQTSSIPATMFLSASAPPVTVVVPPPAAEVPPGPVADPPPPVVEVPPAVEVPPPPAPPQQRPINVTITADAPLDAAVIQAAHAALNAQAIATPDNTPAPADTPGAGQTATAGAVDPANVVIAPPPAAAYAPVNV